MSRYYRIGSDGSNLEFSITPGVKSLLFINCLVFLVTSFGPSQIISRWLGVTPELVVRGALWQLLTYQFIHAGFGHLLFNMLALWMFGTAIESTWGQARFLRYYLSCGAGAGICVVLLTYLMREPTWVPTVGASGAIFGILLAFGMMFPNAPIWMFFLFRVPAKIAVAIFGVIEFLGFTQGGGTVSHVAHLGGLLVGYLLIKSGGMLSSPYGYSRRVSTWKKITNWFSAEEWRYRMANWRRRRARKKFEVYMREHGGDKRGDDGYIQ